MVRLRMPARRSALLPSVLASVALFTTEALAQGNNSDDNQSTATPTARQSTATDDNASATPTPDAKESTTGNGDVVISGGESATGFDQTTNDAVAITGGAAGPSGTDSESFPTLTNAPLDFTYPPAAVPDTLDAPFMHRSSAPQGTVFIVVGAILGAFGLGILLWRGIVACLLSRSVRRAAMEQHIANDKASFPAPPAQFYKYSDHNSSLSLAGASAAGRGTRRTNRGPIPSQTPSQSNLFFSPTAAHGAGGANANARDSRFLPSGFYAAGNSSPNNPNHTHSISLTNLRPDSRGMPARGMREVTPPDSPQFAARRDMSSSSLNLSAPGQGNRAPSAYLEDLLDENPQAFPPSQMPPPNPQRSPGPRSPGPRSPGPRF